MFTTQEMGQYMLVPISSHSRRNRKNFKPVSIKDQYDRAMRDKKELEEFIEELKKIAPDKPKEPSMSVIQQSMLLMITALPIGILDLILIRMLMSK